MIKLESLTSSASDLSVTLLSLAFIFYFAYSFFNYMKVIMLKITNKITLADAIKTSSNGDSLKKYTYYFMTMTIVLPVIAYMLYAFCLFVNILFKFAMYLSSMPTFKKMRVYINALLLKKDGNNITNIEAISETQFMHLDNDFSISLSDNFVKSVNKYNKKIYRDYYADSNFNNKETSNEDVSHNIYRDVVGNVFNETAFDNRLNKNAFYDIMKNTISNTVILTPLLIISMLIVNIFIPYTSLLKFVDGKITGESYYEKVINANENHIMLYDDIGAGKYVNQLIGKVSETKNKLSKNTQEENVEVKNNDISNMALYELIEFSRKDSTELKKYGIKNIVEFRKKIDLLKYSNIENISESNKIIDIVISNKLNDFNVGYAVKEEVDNSNSNVSEMKNKISKIKNNVFGDAISLSLMLLSIYFFVFSSALKHFYERKKAEVSIMY